MQQCIFTKDLAPTRTKPQRVRAATSGGRFLIFGKGNVETYDAHAQAARILADTLNWKGRMVPGATKDGYVFVFEGEAWI